MFKEFYCLPHKEYVTTYLHFVAFIALLFIALPGSHIFDKSRLRSPNKIYNS